MNKATRQRYKAWVLGLIVNNEVKTGKGPMKWCKKCSRNHRSREVCRLYLRTRTAKSGRKVKRWAH